MEVIEIDKIMAGLSRERPVFHSEADFQHALAWHIHQAVPGCGVRLEYRPFQEEAMYVDLWLSGTGIALELKYATQLLDHIDGDETYSLKNQSARDVRRYDFVKDIERLEKVMRLEHSRGGYAILLTNDQNYWKHPPNPPNTVDAAFRVHESSRIDGRLAWSERAGAGTTKGRHAPIRLGRSYKLQWRDYSRIGLSSAAKQRHGHFRYLAVPIPG